MTVPYPPVRPLAGSGPQPAGHRHPPAELDEVRPGGRLRPSALADAWLAPVPAARLVVLRWLVAAYALAFLLGRSPYLWHAAHLPASSWHPVGPMSPLEGPPPWWLVAGWWGAGVVAATSVVLRRPRAASFPVLAAAYLVVEAYDTSWGQLFHTGHLITLHLLVLAGAALLGSHDGAERGVPMVSGWPVRLLTAITAITYLLAGVAKLRLGGWDWLDGAALQRQVAYDNLRKELVGSVSSPLADGALALRWLWPPAALATMAVELGAPLAVLWPRTRRWWAIAAWVFHLGVVGLMAIVFAYPVSGVAYASAFPVERLLGPWRRLSAVLRRTAAS